MSPNVVLCGDFNAHVGELSDAHTGFVLDCPEVLETRRYVCNSVNKAGQLLVYLAAAMSMAIATGRVVGDDGQPSLTGNYGDKKSRPDHVLLPPALYKLVCSFKMRGEQSGWTPDPDEFEIPDLSVLEGVVCCQFQKLSAGASSGFDAIPIPFIKHACLPVRCDG